LTQKRGTYVNSFYAGKLGNLEIKNRFVRAATFEVMTGELYEG